MNFIEFGTAASRLYDSLVSISEGVFIKIINLQQIQLKNKLEKTNAIYNLIR